MQTIFLSVLKKSYCERYVFLCILLYLILLAHQCISPYSIVHANVNLSEDQIEMELRLHLTPYMHCQLKDKFAVFIVSLVLFERIHLSCPKVDFRFDWMQVDVRPIRRTRGEVAGRRIGCNWTGVHLRHVEEASVNPPSIFYVTF